MVEFVNICIEKIYIWWFNEFGILVFLDRKIIKF